MNLHVVSLAEELLTPEILSSVAVAERAARRALFRASIIMPPVVVDSLTDLASTPAGAHRLLNLIGQQQAHVLCEVASSLEMRRLKKLSVGGLQDLTFLIGRARVAAMVTRISLLSGLGRSATTALLGITVVIVLGVIARATQADRPDAASLMDYLQIDNESSKGEGALVSSGLSERSYPPTAARIRVAGENAPVFRNGAGAAYEALRPSRLVWLAPLLLAASFLGGISGAGTGERAGDALQAGQVTAVTKLPAPEQFVTSATPTVRATKGSLCPERSPTPRLFRS